MAVPILERQLALIPDPPAAKSDYRKKVRCFEFACVVTLIIWCACTVVKKWQQLQTKRYNEKRKFGFVEYMPPEHVHNYYN